MDYGYNIMFSPELIRYIIDPNKDHTKDPKSKRSKVELQDLYSECDSIKKDIKNMRCNKNLGFKLYKRIFKIFQKLYEQICT